MKTRTALWLAPCLTVGLTAAPAAPPDTRAIEQAAHGGYVAAINSNRIENFAAVLADDVVFQAPGEPEIVGKAAVTAWGQAYLDAYRTHWEKTPIGFTVQGDWAFERYRYKVTDTDRKTGAVSTDIGKGINVFRRGGDGKWRVAIDRWNSDKLAAP